MDAMTPEDRDALVLKISAKMKAMTDDELTDLAKELAVEEADDKKPSVIPTLGEEKPVVDTGVLAGPIPALKNFLIKSQRDNESKS